MALLTKEIEEKLQEQSYLGSEIDQQDVICKVYNAFGPGCWYLINQDPEEGDYLWCIASFDGKLWELGCVLKSELESVKVGDQPLIQLDLNFQQMNAAEAFNRLYNGEQL
ncbi:DUF2958 domain-containing protein [Cesiribacter sp. SM1]|uniref:DUF2958 domain-containing protein n=1 Tax=Cesiribacter sp. SM1 TaxID=2861196 RepID=UPI001CD44ECE|nr:DUF2958 domain-containing protein [Cesiribacter sp. SM1]